MTDYSYFYYIRKGTGVDILGLIDTDGAALASGSTVVIKGEGYDDNLTFAEDETLELRDEYVTALANIVTYELGLGNSYFIKEFTDAKRKLRGEKVAVKYQTARVRPHNLRGDLFTYVRSE